MKARSRGHVVLIGSVTSYFGWPTLAAYGATKAALNNMAEALRYDFVKMNIRIQIMNPGFVDTPLAAKNRFADAGPDARGQGLGAHGARQSSHGGFETTFPRRLTWGLKFLRLLPHDVIFAFMNYATRWKGRPLVPRGTSQS